MKEQFREEIMKLVGRKLGKGYGVTRRDTEGRNGHIRHEICIHKTGEAQPVAVCLEDAVLRCIEEGLPPEGLPDGIVQMYLQEEVSRHISMGLYGPAALEGMVRVRLVNYESNSSNLEGRPHRRILDLAADYYLDIEAVTGIDSAAVQITNRMAGDWGITEERLYRIGMMSLLAHGGCQIIEVESLLLDMMGGMPDEMKGVLDKLGQKAEMYVISSPGRCFGAACLLDTAFLQEVAEEKGCDLLIYPSSVHEAIAVPFRDGNGATLGTRDIQEINEWAVPKYERLSNSVYRYDREKKEVSIFRKGGPL